MVVAVGDLCGGNKEQGACGDASTEEQGGLQALGHPGTQQTKIAGPRLRGHADFCPPGLLLFEVERGGVDAVAQAGGVGAVGEDVAEVGAAARRR